MTPTDILTLLDLKNKAIKHSDRQAACEVPTRQI